MASSKGLNAELLRRFNAMAAAAKAAGHNIGIGSGARSIQEQIDLRRQNCGTSSYDIWQKPANQCSPATAIPGRSQHNRGLAIDFSGDDAADAWVAANAARFGLHLPVSGENWHLEMREDGKSSPHTAGSFPFAGELEQANPEDELASRIHSIMRVVGMGDTDTTLPEDLIGLEGADMEDGVEGVGEPPDSMTIEMPFDTSAMGIGAGGGGATPGSTGPQQVRGAYQHFAQNKLKEFGWSPGEMNALIELWNRESNWDPLAQNPTSSAFGIAQFLNGTWAGTGFKKTKDPYKQVLAGLTYIKGRYGSPSQALAFHDSHNWY